MKRLIALIFFQLAFHTSTFVLAQEKIPLISIQFNQTELKTVLAQLERETKLPFFYADSWLDSTQITANFEKNTLSEVLTKVLASTRLYFIIYKDQVILSRDNPILQKIAALEAPQAYEETESSRIFARENPWSTGEASQKPPIEIGNKALMMPGKSVTLAGYIREKKNGEPIVGALVYAENPFRAISTNSFGFYSLTLRAGLNELKTQFAGMKPTQTGILLYSDGKLDIELEEDVISLNEVLIESERDVNVSGVQMGLDRIDIKTMKNIPKVLGENDLIQVTLTLPGVQSIGEGASGFNVRGGNSDQNLVLLNDAPIFNTSHFLGFFSVFNADVIKKTELHKSSIPARYGSRLSSILDIQMKEGNLKKFSGQGGFGPVTGRLSLEIPLVKEKTSLILGGRTTYSDWVLNFVPDEVLRNSRASFYDAVMRISHQINDNNSLSLSSYFSRDQFRLSTDSLFSYRNFNASFQWRHNFNNKFYGVLSSAYSQYDYNLDYQAIPVDAFKLGFKIQETDLRLDLGYYQGNIHRLDFGWVNKFYFLEPGYIQRQGNESLISRREINQEQGLESALYFSDQVDLNTRFSLHLGIRYSWFGAFGPAEVFNFQSGLPRELSTIVDSTDYKSAQLIQSYHGPEWRLAARYSLGSETSLKISYNRTRQYIHRLSNSISVSPTDTWKLSDSYIAPQLADQVSLGIYRNFKSSSIETSLEIYYKRFNNLLDYKVGADLILNENLATDVLQGRGKAYGLEVLLRKKNGKLNGWMSYTFSRTFLKLDGAFRVERVNNGSYFPANFDKPHNLSFVSNYRFTQRYSISLNFTYSTGRPITFPIGNYQIAGGNVILFSQRNQFRIPDYYRLDFGINIEGSHKIKKLAHSFWTVSVYNVLGRKNPYSVFFVVEDGKIQGRKLSVFGAPIPTITYNFSF